MSDAMTDVPEDGGAAKGGGEAAGKEKKESRLEYYERLSFHEVYLLMDQDAKDQEYLVKLVSEGIEYAVKKNDRRKATSTSTEGPGYKTLQSFKGETPPISAQAYVKRIYKYGGLSPCNLVISLIFIDRFWTSVRGEDQYGEEVAFIPLRTSNFQRLFLVACMIASKFWDGYYYSNAHWAEVAGITLQELNRLELKFLFGLTFHLQVDRDEYEWWCKAVRKLVAQKAEENQMQSMETKLLKAAAKWNAKNPDGHKPWRDAKAAEGAEGGDK
mmetsp:Transcript_20038/g.47767  ORF Transcript_20038/g.47767 Transcript_20038/m.47767 type:complete len:271 (+) Transcript_20038:145-957(+)